MSSDDAESTRRFEDIERRLRELEKHSHEPIDLEPAIRDILKDAAGPKWTG